MLAVLQKDPSLIRSLILDSPLPTFIPIDEQEPVNFNKALDILFDNCAKDSADKVRYSGLKEKFTQYFTSIIGKTFYLPYLEKGTTDTIQIQYTKNELLDVIVGGMLNSSGVKDVPFIITETWQTVFELSVDVPETSSWGPCLSPTDMLLPGDGEVLLTPTS